jgi:hypothetical protein
METITLRASDGQDVKVPIAHAFGPDGKPAELIGDIERLTSRISVVCGTLRTYHAAASGQRPQADLLA